MSEAVKVLIADDHALVRKGLLALLEAKPDVQVVGEAADGIEAVRMAGSCLPDIILMDLEMPRKDGINAIKEIRQQLPHSKILVLTSYTDDQRVIAAIRAGANGYLLKTTMPDDLLRAIREVLQGRMPLDPEITGAVIRELERPAETVPTRPENLTEREIDVMRLIAKGYPNRQIAEELLISDRTVSTHVGRILKKLQLENRTQIALFALRKGLADLDDAE
jgi:NarL family two-component system response regulator LiaR